MKTVLIPTDFSLESTKIIDALIEAQPEETFNVIFLHAFKLSDSMSDMLMLSRRSRDYENVSDDFYQQLNKYKSIYSQHINSIGIEYFYGSTIAAFKNFLETFEVSFIVYPNDYQFKLINKYSINPKLLTERSGCDVLELNINNITAVENLIDSRIPESEQQEVSV